jgi:hypothetical protein
VSSRFQSPVAQLANAMLSPAELQDLIACLEQASRDGDGVEIARDLAHEFAEALMLACNVLTPAEREEACGPHGP